MLLSRKVSTDKLIQLDGLKKAMVKNTETDKMMRDPSRADETHAKKSLGKPEETE
jgi:hypothetical protein